MDRYRITCDGCYTEVTGLIALMTAINDWIEHGKSNLTIEKI